MENYYQILEVDKKASIEVIKKVHKYLIKKNHPDLFEGKEKKDAEEKCKKINEAYCVLSNDEKRKEYDKFLLDLHDDEKLLNENKILKEQIDFLNTAIEKKDFIINTYINENTSNAISNRYVPQNEENIVDNSQNFFFKNLLYTFTDIFFKPLIFIVLLFILLLILKNVK